MAPTIRIAIPPSKPKLLDQVRDVIRRKHYSFRTEQTYLDWTWRYNKASKKVDLRVKKSETGHYNAFLVSSSVRRALYFWVAG
jgi:hypothetical protein